VRPQGNGTFVTPIKTCYTVPVIAEYMQYNYHCNRLIILNLEHVFIFKCCVFIYAFVYYKTGKIEENISTKIIQICMHYDHIWLHLLKGLELEFLWSYLEPLPFANGEVEVGFWAGLYIFILFYFIWNTETFKNRDPLTIYMYCTVYDTFSIFTKKTCEECKNIFLQKVKVKWLLNIAETYKVLGLPYLGISDLNIENVSDTVQYMYIVNGSLFLNVSVFHFVPVYVHKCLSVGW
jgi:hypothetical protein